jgi:hypothetical protein
MASILPIGISLGAHPAGLVRSGDDVHRPWPGAPLAVIVGSMPTLKHLCCHIGVALANALANLSVHAVLT